MNNQVFDSGSMALGYARFRPPLHPLIVDRLFAHLSPIGRALDLGCGAGLSTAPLVGRVPFVAGLEPFTSMLAPAPSVAPGAHFLAAAGERLPFANASFDLVTAAGALNYTDLDLALPELRRVLRPAAPLAVYDFAMGSDFAHSPALTLWHAEFKRLWPSPPAREISPEILVATPHGLRLLLRDPFTLSLSLDPDFYLEYALTETNVSAAVQRGVPASEIRAWCRQTLDEVFAGAPREVLFNGYLALLDFSA